MPLVYLLIFFGLISSGCQTALGTGSGGLSVSLSQSISTLEATARVIVLSGTQEVASQNVTGLTLGTTKEATFNVTNGTYTVQTFIDANSNTSVDTSEAYDQQSNLVVSGSTVTTVLFLNQLKSHWGQYTLSGRVLGSSSYNTHIGLYTDDFVQNPGASLRGGVVVNKQTFANYKFRVKNGSYYVGAFVDSNENGTQDDTDRLGAFGWNTSTEEAVAQPVTVASDTISKNFSAYARVANIASLVLFDVEEIDALGAGDGDRSATTGLSTSLKLDRNGAAHIVHWRGYATNKTGTWVKSSGGAGRYASLAIDANGVAHMSHYIALAEDLLYSTNATGQWATTVVDADGRIGIDTSIAVDSNGKVHISYTDLDNDDLNYATNVTGQWASYAADTTGSVGRYTSLAVDSTGRVHISYYDSSNGDLKYVQSNGVGQWTTPTTVDSEGDVGMFTSLALDSNGKVHISYYDRTNANLKYATNKSGNWVIENVDSSEDDVGSYSSIAVGTNGKAHIAFHNYTLSSPKYATNSTGKWVTHRVGWGGLGREGTDTSIAVDSNGKVHISYFDVVDKEVKYAKSK